MKRKFVVIGILILVLMASTNYIDVPAVKAPLAPITVYYAPKMIVENISLPKPKPPVLQRVTPADMQKLDLRQASGFSSAEIESVAKYNLCGLGANFVEQDNKINAIFLMSVAALESGWGRYKLNQYNLFGMYHYHPQSYAECITHVANVLVTNYLTQGGQWHNGVTISAVNIKYCVNSDGSPKTSWTDEVSEIMANMYNQIYLAEYKQGT
jgi:hypothetical protein